MTTAGATDGQGLKQTKSIKAAVVRFAGDSGDGMQLVGTQFTDTIAIFGNDLATLPDYPSEIRAPAGTVAGVSAFQVNFADSNIYTPGDKLSALIAMNPAAFKAHIEDVEIGGIVVVNESEFTKVNLKKAGFAEGYNPLDDEKYTQRFKIYRVPISRLNEQALASSGLSAKEIDRCKNMYALGLIYWMYNRQMDVTENYLNDYFGKAKKLPHVAAANISSLRAGFNFGETAEIFPGNFHVARAQVAPGKYRKITGNEAVALGMIVAAKLAGKDLVYCSYPITPASDILHSLAAMRNYNVKTFQAEDEIAAMGAAIGAAYAGQIGATGTSGPGLCLKSEAINLAIMTELPVVIVDVQRGGPSTGLPTKTEQSDLLQAISGRNGDSPLVVLAPQSPADCFDITIDAIRIAIKYMLPVLILSDGYLANGAEPWRIPAEESFEKITVAHPSDPATFKPYSRDGNLARPWAIPGTPGLEHRIGGLEKSNIQGNVSHDPANHHTMTEIRFAKVARVVQSIPPIQVYGDADADLLVLGWGGTYGSIVTAIDNARKRGRKVAGAHIRYLNPFPANLGELLKQYKKILVPELNMGQLRSLIRARFLVDARGLNKVYGKPFLIEEIEQAIDLMVEDKFGDADYVVPQDHKVQPSNFATR